MRKHGGPPSRRDKHVTLAAISPPGVARGRFVGGQQSGLAGCKPPPLFTRGASSCSSQGRRQGEPWGASPRPSAPTYLPTTRISDRRLSVAAKYRSPSTRPPYLPHFLIIVFVTPLFADSRSCTKAVALSAWARSYSQSARHPLSGVSIPQMRSKTPSPGGVVGTWH